MLTIPEWILLLVALALIGFIVFAIVTERRMEREHQEEMRTFEGFRGEE